MLAESSMTRFQTATKTGQTSPTYAIRPEVQNQLLLNLPDTIANRETKRLSQIALLGRIVG